MGDYDDYYSGVAEYSEDYDQAEYYDDGEAEYADVETGQAEYYDDGEAEYVDVEAGQAEYYADGEAEYADVETGQAEYYDDGEAEYADVETGQAEYYDDGEAEYADVEAGQAEYYADGEAEYSEDYNESYDLEGDYTQGELEYSDGEAEYADGEEGSSTANDDEHLEQNDHPVAENLEDDEYSDTENFDGDEEWPFDGAAGCSEQKGHSGDTAEYSEEEDEYTDDDEYFEDDEPVPSKASSSKAAVPKNISMPKAKPSSSETLKLIPLSPSDVDYSYVSEKMHKSIVKHSTMHFTKYKIMKIEKVWNTKVYSRFKQHVQRIREETDDMPNVTMLFHGSPKSHEIVKRGFDERHASKEGMYGAGVYFAQHSSKSNQYAFGLNAGCGPHRTVDCQHCTRLMMLCRVVLGNVYTCGSAQSFAHAPPGHHSVEGSTSAGNLRYPEYIVYRGEQAFPEYLITYKILK